MARRPIPTSESFWRGQDMLYSRPNYALVHILELIGNNAKLPMTPHGKVCANQPVYRLSCLGRC